MEELYRRIQNLDPGKEYELYTILAGEHAGGKVLVADGETEWTSSVLSLDGIRALPERSVLHERLTTSRRLIVCGGGFVGQAVVRIASLLGWHVIAIDDRQEYAAAAAAAGAEEVLHGDYAPILSGIRSDEGTLFVVVTREHRFDRECLEEILKKPFGYLGVMGSHARTDRLRKDLRQAGISGDLIGRIHAPIGLSIGARTPEEIAVSIAAQMIEATQNMPEGSAIPDALMSDVLKACDPGSREKAAMAVISFREGSTPRAVGTRMLIREDGTTSGTIGGGIMEAEVIRTAVRLMKEQDSFMPCVCRVDLSGRSAERADLLCGGVTEVFLESLNL